MEIKKQYLTMTRTFIWEESETKWGKTAILSNYLLFIWLPRATFRPLTGAASLSQWWSLIFSCELDLEVTQSHVTRLGLEAWPSVQWGMNKEPFISECNTLNRVFQIALRVEGNHAPLGEIGNFSGGFFY